MALAKECSVAPSTYCSAADCGLVTVPQERGAVTGRIKEIGMIDPAHIARLLPHRLIALRVPALASTAT